MINTAWWSTALWLLFKKKKNQLVLHMLLYSISGRTSSLLPTCYKFLWYCTLLNTFFFHPLQESGRLSFFLFFFLSFFPSFSPGSIWCPVTHSPPQTVWPDLCSLGRWGLQASLHFRSRPLCWLPSTADTWRMKQTHLFHRSSGIKRTKAQFIITAFFNS